jgi:hypothetical protein
MVCLEPRLLPVRVKAGQALRLFESAKADSVMATTSPYVLVCLALDDRPLPTMVLAVVWIGAKTEKRRKFRIGRME